MVSSLHLLAATTSDIGHGCASTTTSLSYLQPCSNVKMMHMKSHILQVNPWNVDPEPCTMCMKRFSETMCINGCLTVRWR
uniref:Uncharacterized protein n=1 Tax=Setaria viridis TaxID=4556 RepID=A0A4U6T4H1_SETVI|nr:hypothetical protein SEVIR_9G437801v2 [Setaria viridis]